MFSTRKHQLAIKLKGINWLSQQKGPTGYQGKRDQLAITVKGNNWLSQ